MFPNLSIETQVYLGGFLIAIEAVSPGISDKEAKEIHQKLSEHFDRVESWPFRNALGVPSRFWRAMNTTLPIMALTHDGKATLHRVSTPPLNWEEYRSPNSQCPSNIRGNS